MRRCGRYAGAGQTRNIAHRGNDMGENGMQAVHGGEVNSEGRHEHPRLTVHASEAGVVVTDREGRIILMNRAAAGITGQSMEEALGTPLERLLCIPKNGQGNDGFEASTPDTGEASLITGTLAGAGGRGLSISLCEGSDHHLHDAVLGSLHVFADLTRENRNESALRQLAAIVESTDDAIIGTALDGIITSWNRGAERIYGYSAEEIIGHHISRLAPHNRRQEFMHIIERIKRGESIKGYESSRLRKDGKRIYVSITTSPLRNASGRITGFSTISRDITGKKRAEQKMKEYARDLRMKNEELEQFAYVASHDLQEPLRMVASYVQLLKKRYEGKLDADADEFIQYAVEGSERMRVLINDLLVYSRVSTKDTPFNEINSEEILKKVLYDLQFMIGESHAEIFCDPLPVVWFDESQLSEVFLNLISNAIKFHGEAPPVVHLSARQGEAEWIFSVRDNGIGIEPQYFSRIFTIFQRLHTRSDYPGTGIGLAICKKIIERHGGRIWVESTPGKGSTFFFSILEHEP
jgi:PAS domain S-box-containing protein